MSGKRFTMCHEQNDLNGWTMSIIDWETKQPFDYSQYEVHSSSITDTKDEMEDLCLLLNELNDENQLLTEEKELLKNKLDRIEDILPHFLSCAEISEFHSKTFKEDIALMKCWNKRYQK